MTHVRQTLPLVLASLLSGCAPPSPSPSASPTGVVSENVRWRDGENEVRGLFARPAGNGPFPILIIVHGDRGLTSGVKEEALALAARGCMAFAIDLYRGEVVGEVLDAHIMERGLSDDQVRRDLKLAVDRLTKLDRVRSERVGILGWDMGGGHALEAAMADPRIKAVVICYGKVPTEAKTVSRLQASVLGVFAGKDEGISPATVEQFRAALRKNGKGAEGVHILADCEHGFLDPGQPRAGSAADAWKQVLDFLDRELGTVQPAPKPSVGVARKN